MMDLAGRSRRRARVLSVIRVSLVVLSLFVVRDAPAHVLRVAHFFGETLVLQAPTTTPRIASWAESLPPIEVTSMRTRATAAVRLYTPEGEIDQDARVQIERIAGEEEAPHPLASRLEQLVIAAAYHFNAPRIIVVSGFRPRASRHGTGDAMDFKLKGVSPRVLAAYLRGLPRAGVGVYTHPDTQFVHLDVRDQSYHWVDASPPGVKWHVSPIWDPGSKKRDAAWTPQMDLPAAQ